MKIVNRSEFLALPQGTFYAKVSRERGAVGLYGDLEVKGETWSNDWWATQVVAIDTGDQRGRDVLDCLIEREDEMRETGASYPINSAAGRDGSFDADQLFLVFETDDLVQLRGWIDQAIVAATSPVAMELPARATVSGRAPANPAEASVPDSARRADGQHVDHWVLPEEERAKGFVRPVRDAYVHVGTRGPSHPLRDLTAEERQRYQHFDYVKFEPYPESALPVTGRYWTQADLDKVGKGCGTRTTMPRAIAETYARDPNYYGRTFCCGCGKYLPVGEDGEFIWSGSDERVGS